MTKIEDGKIDKYSTKIGTKNLLKITPKKYMKCAETVDQSRDRKILQLNET